MTFSTLRKATKSKCVLSSPALVDAPVVPRRVSWRAPASARRSARHSGQRQRTPPATRRRNDRQRCARRILYRPPGKWQTRAVVPRIRRIRRAAPRNGRQPPRHTAWGTLNSSSLVPAQADDLLSPFHGALAEGCGALVRGREFWVLSEVSASAYEGHAACRAVRMCSAPTVGSRTPSTGWRQHLARAGPVDHAEPGGQVERRAQHSTSTTRAEWRGPERASRCGRQARHQLAGGRTSVRQAGGPAGVPKLRYGVMRGTCPPRRPRPRHDRPTCPCRTKWIREEADAMQRCASRSSSRRSSRYVSQQPAVEGK